MIKKSEVLRLFLAVLLIMVSGAFAQKSYILYSQKDTSGISDIVRYDTATGETVVLTCFGKTDHGSILSISASSDYIYFTRPSIPNSRPNPAIWRISVDGSGLTDFLSPDTTISYYHVAVSPDGNKIAYTANDSANPSGSYLYLCSSDGSNRIKLTNDPNWICSYPVFVNNDTILFRVKNGYLENYYTVTTAGVLTNLTNNESISPYFPRLGRPMLNYKRDTIVYAKQVQDSTGYRKWALYNFSPISTSGVENLLTDALYFETGPLYQEEPYPAYGSNDTSILFCGSLAGNVYDLYNVNIPIINPYLEMLTTGNYHITLPVLTSTVARSQRYVYVQNGYVYVRDETGNPVRVTASSGNRNPAINKRGTMIAFASGNGLYTVRPDGTNLVQIDSSTTVDYPEFSPDGLWVLFVKNGDIYARVVDCSKPAARLTYTGNVAGKICFSPDGQEIAFTGLVNGKKHIFLSSVQFSYDTMTILLGAPRDITPLTADNYSASWSPDGSLIVFISTRNQVPEIWLMNRDGSSQRKIIFALNSPVNPSSVCFSGNLSNIIYYVSGTPQAIWTADISQQQIIPGFTGVYAEYVQVSNVPSGVIEGERMIGIKERDPYVPFTYYLLMHVDKVPLPQSAILTEKIPDGWVLTSVKINGSTPSQMTSNGATESELKWLFGKTGIAPLQDSILQITIEHKNPASETYGEYRAFPGWCETYGVKTFTRGISNILISNPYIPVDFNRDWKISDEELLRTIYLWSINGRVSGWPEDLNDWDMWLLTTIGFWANTSGYEYDLTNSRSQGKYLWKKL
ncbi:MAG: hypothetical protein NC825_05160 [Candidatus Omnitrophica bacterium]|nr:hypothetical protein [Candidatus Omnitrophota bacterium]